jgi:phosphatidylglycerol lysyltransferase
VTRLSRLAARQPFALAYAAALLALALLTGPVTGPDQNLRQLFGTGYEPLVENGHWWSPLTSVFFVHSGFELLLALFGALVVLGLAERLLGTRRLTVVFALTAIAGPVLGTLGQSLGVSTGEMWSRGVRELEALDPGTPIAGCILAASGVAGALVRRRIRVLAFSAMLVLLLFSGQPSDLYRLLAGLLGLAIGALVRHPAAPLSWRRSTDHEARTLLAALVAIVAVGPVATLFSRGHYGLLAPLGLLLTGGAPSRSDIVDRCTLGDITAECVRGLTIARAEGPGPLAISLLPLLALLVASYGMARGRRFAAWLAITVSAGLGALGFWYYVIPSLNGRATWRWHSPHYWEVALVLIASVVVPLAVAGLVAAQLRRFPVHGAPGRSRRFLVVIAGSLVVLAAAYVGIGALLSVEFRPAVTVADLIADVPERFIPVAFLRTERPLFLPTGPAATILYQWVGPIFWLILIAAAVSCLRSAPRLPDESERSRLRQLLMRRGGGSLAFPATWARNAVWLNEAGTAAVAYRVVNGVALTTSEPIGPDPASPDPEQQRLAAEAVAEFAVTCDHHGWVPALYGIHDDWRKVVEGLGWDSVPVGEEAILRPRNWATAGKKWQNVRTSLRRAERLGIRSTWSSYAELPRLQALQIREISEQWVAEKELPEMGFTLGGIDELLDPEVRLMLAVDPGGRVLAVTSWLPAYRDGIVVGWTLDLMRRRPDGPNGVMEFLIAQTAALLKEDPRIEFLSLAAAPLAGSIAEPSDEPGGPERILAVLGRALEPVYGFRSLLAFKRKFQPELHPLFLALPDRLALPAVGVALTRAYLPSLSLPAALALVRRLGEPRAGATVPSHTGK